MAKKLTIPTEKITKFFKELPKKAGPFFKSLPKKIVDFVKNFPDTLKKAPVDEKIAYGAIGLGAIFLIIGIIL